MDEYLPRIVDSEVSRAIGVSGALLIEGARAVGKSATARQHARSELRLDSTDPLAVLAREMPSVALGGEAPRLLDEHQLIPGLWNEVRHAVDDRQKPGQFLLTGSASPSEDPYRHSGAGRFRHVMMRTMAFVETSHSSGDVSLRALLGGSSPTVTQSELEFRDVIGRIVSGGWPGWRDVPEEDAQQNIISYLDDISQHVFPQVAGVRRDPRRLVAFVRAMASFTAQSASFAAMTRRVDEDSTTSIGHASIPELHDFASRMYLTEDQPAWSPQLRSRTAAIQTPKRHLCDPSLAAALLGAGTDRLLLEPTTLGFLFESQVVHDLRVFAQACGARGVFHYRDEKGRDEIDAVVEANDGSWLAVEVKLGKAAIDTAAANLLRVTAKMVRPPVACVVVVPVGIAHQRADGVYVVPLTTLGP